MKTFTLNLLAMFCFFVISGLNSGYAQEWNISNEAFTSLEGDITETTTVEDLTIYASADDEVTIGGNNKSIGDFSFSYRLKLNGSGDFLEDGTPEDRVLAFDVNGNTNITIAAISASSSEDRELTIETAEGGLVGTFPVLGAEISMQTFQYEGDATTIYLYSPSSGVNLYYIKAESPQLDTLTVSSGEMVPEFDPEVTKYQVNVPAGTSSISFGATAAEGVELDLPDDLSLSAGDNQVVTLTATSGVSKTYSVHVHAQAENEILYLSASNGVFATAKAFDTNVYNALVEGGYSVTFAAKDAIFEWSPEGINEFDYSPYSGIVIGGGAGSTNTIDYAKRNYPIPVVSFQNDGPKGNKWGWDVDPVTTKSYDEETVKMKILNNEHPITAGYNVDDLVQWNLGTADSADWSGKEIKSYDLSDSIPSAVALATIVADGSLEPTMWAIPAGAEVTSLNNEYDNYERATISSNIVLMYLYNDGLLYMSDDLKPLLLNSLEWAMSSSEVMDVTASAGTLSKDEENSAYQLVLPKGTNTAEVNVITSDPNAEIDMPTINVADGETMAYDVTITSALGDETTTLSLTVHTQTDGEVLYLSSDPEGVSSSAKAFDSNIYNTLVEGGYSVTFADRGAIFEWSPEGINEFDYSPYSGMVIGGGTGSTNTIDYAKRNYPIPVVSFQNDGPKGNKWGWDVDPVTTKSYDEETVKMKILNNEHPITADYNVDDLIQWNLGTADSADWSGKEIKSYDLSDSIPSAVALATIVADGTLEPTMWAIPAGAEVTSLNNEYDNYERATISSNIVLMYLYNDGLLYMSDDLKPLLLNALEWAASSTEILDVTASAGTLTSDEENGAYQLVLPAGTNTADINVKTADPNATVSIPTIDVADGETATYEITVSSGMDLETATIDLTVHTQAEDEIFYLSASNGVYSTAKAFDTNVYDALVEGGYSVTFAPKNAIFEWSPEGINEFDYSPYSGMVIGGGAGSTNTIDYAKRNYPIPVVSLQNDGPKGNKWGWDVDPVTTKSYDVETAKMQILNNEHPITSDYNVDDLVQWTLGTPDSADWDGKEIKSYDLSETIPAAVPLATIVADGSLEPTMWAIPAGVELTSLNNEYDNYETVTTSSNVVLMYLFNDGLLYMSEDMKPLLLNSLEWALESNVEAKKVAYVTNGDNTMSETAAPVTDDPIIRMLEADELIDVEVLAVSADSTLDLSDYDVVIAQESFSSSADIYKPTGSLGMGNVEVPFIFNKNYAMKEGRGFADGASGSGSEVAGTYYINVSADNQENALFSGVEFTADSVQIFKSGATDAGADGGEKGLQYAADVEISAENTLLANGVNDPENATVCINDIPAGSTIGSETLQARMFAFAMNFGAICKDDGGNITDAGLTIWRNAVYLAAGLEVPAEGVTNSAAIESIATSAGFVNFNDEAGAAQLVLPVGTSTADLTVTTSSSDASVELPTINVSDEGAYENYEIVVKAPFGGSVVYPLEVHKQSAEEILYVSSDPDGVYSAARAFDTNVFDQLIASGYSVTFADRKAIFEWSPEGINAFDYSPYSAMVLSGGTGSSNVNDYAKRNYPIPAVSMQNDGPKGNKWGWDIDPVTTKSYDEETVKLEILNNHPITEGYNVGDKVQWTLGTADSADWSGNEIKSYNLTDDIPSAVALATIVADGSLEPTMWAIPAGVEVTSLNEEYDNYETVTTSSNIVLMYLFNDGLLYASDDFGTLLDNSLQWAMSEVTQSSDATLSSLTVSEGALDPEFAASTTTYSVNLPTGTESVTVEAIANHAAASVSGAGEITIPDGGTTAEVLVTAEDGTTKTYTVEFTVGVSVNDLVNEWKVYPNPVRSILNIEGNQVLNAEVFNMSGMKMDVKKYNLNQIDVSNLLKGVYILKIEGVDNSISIQKFNKE